MSKEQFNRFAPLIGGLFLSASAVLRVLGQGAIADTLDVLTTLTGLAAVSIVSVGEAATLVSAGAVLYGVWRKLRALRSP